MKKYIVIILLFTFAACKSKMAGTAKVEENKTVSATVAPTTAALAEGKAHYESHCGSCHELHLPNSFSATKWNKIVPIMVDKANESAGKEVVSMKMQADILSYLQSQSFNKF